MKKMFKDLMKLIYKIIVLNLLITKIILYNKEVLIIHNYEILINLSKIDHLLINHLKDHLKIILNYHHKSNHKILQIKSNLFNLKLKNLNHLKIFITNNQLENK